MKSKTTTKALSWWDNANKEASNLAKWIALYEAVNIVADKAEEKGVSPEEIVYKPKAIRDYIESTQDIIMKKILHQDYNIEICYSEENSEKEFEAEFI
jgi:predicted Zn-dependent protease with MMP-like domain